MFINTVLQEITFKIVYYGPGLSGKTANLIYIYNHINPSLRSEMITLSTKEDRTLFFDFMQLDMAPIKGKKPRFNLYTTPGQIQYGSSRHVVLNGADGVVFVADSQRDRLDDNLASMAELEEALIENGSTLADFPWILQYNKRDLVNIFRVKQLQELLNFCNVPYFESVAPKGAGVFNTLKAVINGVVAHAQKKQLRDTAYA